MATPDYFAAFSLPQHLNIDLPALEKSFYAQSRKLHPDRFASKPLAEQEAALAQSSLLNDAYRTLKNPITRTEYLLKLHGAQIGEEHSANGTGASRVPRDLLEEVFDLNMQLEEMRMAHKTGAHDPALAQTMSETRKRFEDLRETVDRDLRTQWTAWDNGDEPARQASQKAMVALLDRRRYLSNLVRDVTETLDGKHASGVFNQRGR